MPDDGDATGISVVIPTFNRPGHLLEAVHSVLEQTVLPSEIVVVDNHPGQTGKAAMALIRETDRPLVRYVSATGVDGVSYARNRGADVVNGQWVAFLDDDDLWLPGYLESVTKSLRGSDGTMALTWMLQKGPDGTLRDGKSMHSGTSAKRFYLRNPGVTGSNLVVSREVFGTLGGFDERLSVSEDKDLLIRFVEAGGQYVVVPERLVIHRLHTEGHLAAEDNPRYLEGMRLFYEKHRRSMGLFDRMRLQGRIAYVDSRCAKNRWHRLFRRLNAMLLAEPRSWGLRSQAARRGLKNQV